jgi:predicted TIM-barrel fold metal-dependent hydrolase
MIIDALTHVTPDGRWFSTAHDASVDRLRRELDASDVDAAVVVALAGHIPNDFVLEVSLHDPRLLPGCSVDPRLYDAASFRAEFQGSPFRVLKLHPRLNRYDPLDPACLAILEELASWSHPMPVWLCSLFHTPGVALRKPPVETACELADRFPALQFVFLHGAGPLALQLAEALRERVNAYIDLSMSLLRYAGSAVALDHRWLLARFDRRTMFGSDFPEAGISEAQAALRQAARELPDEKLAHVAGGTLARLLRLS